MRRIFRRENILAFVPLLFSFYIYFIKNDNPRWAMTFQGISDSFESAIGFCSIWWVIFVASYILHLQLREKNIASMMRWLHIIFSIICVALFYWLFFEKTGIIPGWHTTVEPFNLHVGNIEIPILTFMLISCAAIQIFFILFFIYIKKKG